jgi:hypothetical protein
VCTHASPGGEGDGGSIFWKTREIGMPSYSNNLSTLCSIFFTILSERGKAKKDLCVPMKYKRLYNRPMRALLSKDSLLYRYVMTPHDTWADVDNNFFEKVAALKKKGVTVSVALGR